MSGVPASVIRTYLNEAIDTADRALQSLIKSRKVHDTSVDDHLDTTYLMKIQAVTAHLSAAEIAAYDL